MNFIETNHEMESTNHRYKDLLGKILIPETEQLIENVRLTVDENEMYFETTTILPKSSHWKVIAGEFRTIGEITLLNCETDSNHYHSYAGSKQIVRIGQIIVGQKIVEPNPLFNRIVLSSPAFTEWVDYENHLSMIDKTITIPDVEELAFSETDEFKVEIALGYNYSSSRISSTVKRQSQIKVTSKAPVAIEELMKFATKIRKFILFVTNKNPEFSDILVTPTNNITSTLVILSKPLEEHRFGYNLNVGYQLLKNDLSVIMNTWLTTEWIDLSLDLIQSRQFNPSINFSTFLFNTTVALESNFKHFRAVNYANFEKKEKEKIKFIIERIQDNKDYLDSFTARSKYWTEPALRKKFEKYKPVLKQIMGSTFEYSSQKLIDKAVDTRNDIAHRAETSNHFSSTELLLVSKLFEFTFKIEFLKWLGVKTDTPQNNLVLYAKTYIRDLANMNSYNSGSV